MTRRQRLQEIFETLGPRKIWRPVTGPGGEVLARGFGSQEPADADRLRGLDFRHKTVVELGCNFGAYALVARQLGAAHVTGIDHNPLITEAAAIIRDMHGLDGVEYRAGDFMELRGQCFDIAMVIDVLGKGKLLRPGKVAELLDLFDSLARHSIILSLHPVLDIGNGLNADDREVTSLYPPGTVRNGRLHLLEFMAGHLGEGWTLRVIDRGERHDKQLVEFRRTVPLAVCA